MMTNYQIQSTRFPNTQFVFSDNDSEAGNYQPSIAKLLDFMMVDMDRAFNTASHIPLLVMNNPNNNYPFNSVNPRNIILNATPGTYGCQYAFQFAHEYCHFLINSGYPSPRDEWFEEVICECASRHWLKVTRDHFFDANYRQNVDDYLSDIWNKPRVFFPPAQLSESPSNFLHELRNNHGYRESHRYFADLIEPLIESDDTVWSFFKGLSDFSNERSFRDNLQYWSTSSSNNEHVTGIVDIFSE